MTKPAAFSSALFLAPEPVYPKVGGGALRSAALLEYLESRHRVDVIAFREEFAPIAFPGARDLLILDLPRHSKRPLARGLRNSRRYLLARPPLVDRFSGFNAQMDRWLTGRHYDIGVIEHFWCAPYAAVLRPYVKRLVIDLHNIESVLSATRAGSAEGPLSGMFRRFAAAYASLEQKWLPMFDEVLVTSGADASRVQADRVAVYPNTIPFHEQPEGTPEHAIVFTGNLEYDPNVFAVRWFAREIWPMIRRAEPALEWRLVGKNAQAIEPIVRDVEGATIIGKVADAVVEIARSKVAVVPLLAGSGTRFKILEAWAAARPVVSTKLGAEGLGAIDGVHLLIANEARQFADTVIQLVRSPGNLGRDGRALYLERYTTEAGWKMLEDLGL